jgi:hypothetical protein
MDDRGVVLFFCEEQIEKHSDGKQQNSIDDVQCIFHPLIFLQNNG